MSISGTHSLRADLLMLLTALIWGGSFVAQRLSLETIGPFLFNAVRFLLGALVVAVLSRWLRSPQTRTPRGRAPLPWAPGILLGVLIAVSIGAQQLGLLYTKVANAGFISAMYVVIVPLLTLLGGRRLRPGIVLGALCAALGLYYLGGRRLTLGYGDGLELLGATAAAVQVLSIGSLTQKHDPLRLVLIQNLVCGVVSLAVAYALETIRLADIQHSALTIFYGGAVSVGIGYALQAIAQKDAVPAHAAVIFSLEGVFAAVGAWIVIGETLSAAALGGCALVLMGCVLSQ
jgi:drug/metabolite transporter (DMT)-like permease